MPTSKLPKTSTGIGPPTMKPPRTECKPDCSPAVQDVSKMYCEVISRYAQICTSETGKYYTDFLKREAEALREMVLRLSGR